MSAPSKPGLSERLRKLPGQLLLAIVNGTAVLVMAAAILTLIAVSKVTGLADNVASTMSNAVISEVGGDPRQIVANIQRVSDDVHAIAIALEQVEADGVTSLAPDIARLNERLSALQANVDQLRKARENLIDEMIAKMGSSLNGMLQRFKYCPRDSAA